MGYAVAEVAAEMGHDVTLISGPVGLATPSGVRRVSVVSALEMLAAVEGELDDCSVLIMCAAVADWRPVAASVAKLKKADMEGVVRLEPNPDILRTVLPYKGGRIFVGFAAETGDPRPEAERKLREKGLDMIVANDVAQSDAGFEVDTNRVTLITPDEPALALPLMSKREVGRKIMEWVERRDAACCNV